jgi:hypothetical protein
VRGSVFEFAQRFQAIPDFIVQLDSDGRRHRMSPGCLVASSTTTINQKQPFFF